jgi:antitoxin MazE
MKARVQKWGNSLALRIPKAFADEVGIAVDALVDISLADGKILIISVSEPAITLDALLAGITDDNLHSAWETGSAVGNEAWE